MNRNVTPLLLIILGLGLFFTFTNGYIQQLKDIQAVNSNYLQAINNSVALIKSRDAVLNDYNSLGADDKARLDKLLPDNVDNVRLIIDITNIASQHGIPLKNISTNAHEGSAANSTAPTTQNTSNNTLSGTVGVSFGFSASYQNFLAFLGDIQSSLRILDITNLTVTANDTGTYDYSVTLQTYWLK